MDWKSRYPPRFCEDCKVPCVGEFKKVLSLQNSGLIVYLHNRKICKAQKKVNDVNKDENFILHNTSDNNLKKLDFMKDLSQYKSKCLKCNTVLQKVRSLLDEISAIRGKEVLGVCKHCRKANPAGNCKRCEYIVNKYLMNKVKQYEDRQSSFKTWLCKVKAFLHALLVGEKVCRHKMYQENSMSELERLLRELNSPLSMRELEIDMFPSLGSVKNGSLENLTQSKDMLQEIISKLKANNCKRYASDDSLYVSSSKTGTRCVCKYFMDKHIEERRSLEVLTSTVSMEKLSQLMTQQYSKGSIQLMPITDKLDASKILQKSKKEKGSAAETEKKERKGNTIEEKTVNVKSPKTDKLVNEQVQKKAKLTSEDQLLLKLMKERQNTKIKTEKAVKQKNVKQLPMIEDLPTLEVIKKTEIEDDESESVIECGAYANSHLKQMIKGSEIVPFDPHYKIENVGSNVPIISAHEPSISNIGKQTDATRMNKLDCDDNPMKGVIMYQLSNREFIDKGWTKLPTTKVMRRMNIYKMVPASQNDWFDINKFRKIMFYNTGEKLAEIDDDGYGRWYYRNGIVALEYYKAKELNAGQRYIIYSSGQEIDFGKSKLLTVLASFDHLGHGVVYDHYGNERLKYNQSEGIIIDGKIGPPARWKWHTLNDPPVLQHVFIDTHLKCRNPCIEEFLKRHMVDRNPEKTPDAQRLAIELENFASDRARKLLQKFKPFEIRMKTLKLNEQFSLRIMDQANINLLFRTDAIPLRLNLGMRLINNEILDTELTEIYQVVTPYDRKPPRSQSIIEIQQTLSQAKQIGNRRGVRPVLSRNSQCSS